jgi:hypothetical protein
VGADRKGPLAAFVVVTVIAAVLLITSVRSQAAPGIFGRPFPVTIHVAAPGAQLWGSASHQAGQAVHDGIVLAQKAVQPVESDAPRTDSADAAPAGLAPSRVVHSQIRSHHAHGTPAPLRHHGRDHQSPAADQPGTEPGDDSGDAPSGSPGGPGDHPAADPADDPADDKGPGHHGRGHRGHHGNDGDTNGDHDGDTTGDHDGDTTGDHDGDTSGTGDSDGDDPADTGSDSTGSDGDSDSVARGHTDRGRHLGWAHDHHAHDAHGDHAHAGH